MDILDLGWMDGVDRAYAVHCDPTLDVGEVGLIVGPLTAACDAVTVELTGSGGTPRGRIAPRTSPCASQGGHRRRPLSRRLDPRAGAALVWGRSVRAMPPMSSPAPASPAGRCASSTPRPGRTPARSSRSSSRRSSRRTASPHTSPTPPVSRPWSTTTRPSRHYVAASGSPVPARCRPASRSGARTSAWLISRVPGAMARLGTRLPGGVTYDLHQGDLVVDERSIRVAAGCSSARRSPASTSSTPNARSTRCRPSVPPCSPRREPYDDQRPARPARHAGRPRPHPARPEGPASRPPRRGPAPADHHRARGRVGLRPAPDDRPRRLGPVVPGLG